MFRFWKRRREQVWADGYDEGWDASRATFAWILEKRFRALERAANTTPNLYSLEDILAEINPTHATTAEDWRDFWEGPND